MDFKLSEEQEMLVASVRRFVDEEIMPHEQLVEETDEVPPELRTKIRERSIEMGICAANMPQELGGGGLSAVSLALLYRELGRANMGLQYGVPRPSNILQACVGDQRERYLYPSIRGEKTDCLAMTEPEAGSDVRAMNCRAERRGDSFVINGSKHFISHADVSDFVILFAATGVDETARGPRKRITTFLVDMGTPGFELRPGYHSVSHRGYHNCVLEFNDCVVHESQVLGEVDEGFSVANEWLGATRLEVAASCLGRCDRAFELAAEHAAQRRQFNTTIGSFQGVSFKLADMEVRRRAAELLVYCAASKSDEGCMTDMDAAIAKLTATETLAYIADEALQIHGGMGLMNDLPLERIWRDSRVERIWDGTSEIQRMIIARSILRPLEGKS